MNIPAYLPQQTVRLACSILCGTLFWLFFTTVPVAAATATVSNTNDSGPGSLRQTIADAAPGDTITFDASLSGQTVVLSETLTLDKDLTIDGSLLPEAITLSGNNKVRVITIQATAIVTLAHLIIVDGQVQSTSDVAESGGGLLNDGTATINQVRFINNHAYGMAENENESYYYASSGAIRNNGTLTITQSAFLKNSANNGSGGAISNYGQLFIEQSTFAHNAVFAYNGGRGGAIDNSFAATLIIKNSTFYNNQAQGTFDQPLSGGINNRGSLWIYNSTFSDNTAPALDNIYQHPLHLYNTIIASSIGGANCIGKLTTNINNLIEDGSCDPLLTGDAKLATFADHHTPVGSLVLMQALQVDSPALDAGDPATCLATDQRGVARPQHARCDIGAYEAAAFGAGPIISVQGNGWSIAHGDTTPTLVNQTDFGSIAVDQGSITRTFIIHNLGQADLTQLSVTLNGNTTAFHITQLPALTVTVGHTTTLQIAFTAPVTGTHRATVALSSNVTAPNPFTFALQGAGCPATVMVTTSADSGDGSLRQALDTICNGGRVTFAAQLSGQSIYLHSHLLLQRDAIIDGSTLTDAVTLSGRSKVRVLKVMAGVAVTLTKVIIADGWLMGGPYPDSVASIGGGILNHGTLTLHEVALRNNTASAFKGYGAGGAIYNNGILTITQSSFADNGANSDGGALINYGQVVISDSSFSHNDAGDYFGCCGGGGAIYNSGQAKIQNSTFFSNSAFALGIKDGGAIYNTGTLTVTNSTFSNNASGGPYGILNSGGIANYGNFWIYNSTFTDNSAPSLGINNPSPSVLTAREFHLFNTIIANSFGGADCSGTLTTNINNLIEDGTCSAAFLGDPLLGPLVDYGGATFTQALLPGSPAIDAGDNTSCSVADQRGVARPFDGDNNGSVICDIGAYEAVIPVLATATATPSPTPTATRTAMPTPTVTSTPTTTQTPTSTRTPTVTPTPTLSATPPTVTNTPNATDTATTPTVAPTVPQTQIVDNPTLMPTNSPIPPLSPTATPPAASRPGDGNGDQVVDRADISACVQEIFDGDGLFWQDAPTGSYPGTTGCDANQDTVIDAGDIVCTILLGFHDPDACHPVTGQEGTQPTTAQLALGNNAAAMVGQPFPIPVFLMTNRHAVAAAAFVLHFDPNRFTLDPTDRNGDQLADAVTFALPPLASQPFITMTQTAETLSIFLTDIAATPATFSDGALLTVTLTVKPLDSTPVMSTLGFATLTPPSLGSQSGQSLPVQVIGSTVQIAPAPQHLYLPLIQAP